MSWFNRGNEAALADRLRAGYNEAMDENSAILRNPPAQYEAIMAAIKWSHTEGNTDPIELLQHLSAEGYEVTRIPASVFGIKPDAGGPEYLDTKISRPR